MDSSFSIIGGGTSPEDICVICTEAGPEEIENEEGQVEQVQQVQICPSSPTPHYAHLSCITPWYAQADKCPECRADVRKFPLWEEINPRTPEQKIVDLFENQDYETARVLMFYYMKQGVDVDYSYLELKFEKDGYPEYMHTMVYLHSEYEEFIRSGDIEKIKNFLRYFEPKYKNEKLAITYRKSLDINPYLVYVNSAEYVNPRKDDVILWMNRMKDILGFTAIQQVGRGHCNQHGGMWQRGGFFMTCS
jgi:hypothetical protein